MNWNLLTTVGQLAHLDEGSKLKMVLLFKHSTRCGISSLAKNRLESKWKDSDTELLEPYYLDLLSFRPVSNLIENHYGIRHESPQILIISEGKCIYSASQTGISYEDLMMTIEKLKR